MPDLKQSQAPGADLAVTLIQSATHWHDPAANRAMFERRLAALTDVGDIVVLPEMFATGFTMAATEQAETMTGPTVAWLRDQARAIDAVICGSLVIEEAGHCFNRFIAARPDGELVCYDKRHLFRMAGEHEHYAPGTRREVFAVNGWRICPQVCYDLRFPAFCRNRAVAGQLDYDLLLFVANWPARRSHQWRTLLAARAVENLVCVAAVNVIGVDGAGVEYCGDSGAFDPQGEELADLGAGPAEVTVKLSRAALDDWRETFPAWKDADAFDLQ